jgi:pimeloyl-ACP methyl ester carboxylesterase
LTSDQLIVTDSISGFSALTILGKDTAIVAFAGTDPAQAADYVADAKLVFGQPSVQSMQANALVAALSTKYSDIVVTGHSLGGYLATSATLNNEAVSSCIAFDAPGRTDAVLQSLVNSQRTAKVINYTAKDSGISWVGGHVGETPESLDVKENFLNHGIKEICDALGGKKAIAKTWK